MEIATTDNTIFKRNDPGLFGHHSFDYNVYVNNDMIGRVIPGMPSYQLTGPVEEIICLITKDMGRWNIVAGNIIGLTMDDVITKVKPEIIKLCNYILYRKYKEELNNV